MGCIAILSTKKRLMGMGIVYKEPSRPVFVASAGKNYSMTPFTRKYPTIRYKSNLFYGFYGIFSRFISSKTAISPLYPPKE
jgi:hypothetical protein